MARDKKPRGSKMGTVRRKPRVPRERRVRTPHPGVKLFRRWRKSREVWLARWIDPDTGKVKEQSLTKIGRATDAGRREWAISKANSIAARRAAVDSGKPVLTNTLVADAFKSYFAARIAEGLKPLTVVAYESGTKAFGEWAGSNAVVFIESLSTTQLTCFRDWYVARPAHAPLKGTGAKSKWAATTRKRSPAAINKGLNSLRIVLNALRRRGVLPDLHSDDIRDRLSYVKGHKALPVFLKAADVRALLLAAAAHDADCFDLTRDGLTDVSRHVAIRPFVVAALLTGMRFSELTGLRWSDVDFESGLIRLAHSATKTGQSRLISFDVCPSLVTMFDRMKLAAGAGKLVFPDVTRDVAERARERMMKPEAKGGYDAPTFSWHDLRRTCGTFSVCAGVHGPASVFLCARRLGHSVQVAERHYLGQVAHKGAKALEAAYGVLDLLPIPKASEEEAA